MKESFFFKLKVLTHCEEGKVSVVVLSLFQRETLTSVRCMQSGKVQREVEGEGKAFSFYLIKSTHTQRQKQGFNMQIEPKTYSTSLFLNCYFDSSSSYASKACLLAALVYHLDLCWKQMNSQSSMNFQKHRRSYALPRAVE